MHRFIKRLLSGAAALLIASSIPLAASPEQLDVIVSLKCPDGADPAVFAEHYADRLLEAYPSLTSDYTYDTLLCGFHLRLPETLLSRIEALDGVESVRVCGYYEAAAAEPLTASNLAAAAESAAGMMGLDDTADYTGDGVKVAVIDNGFDITHPAFFGNGITETLDIAAVGEAKLNKRLSVMRYVESSAEFYASPKIPFRFDYADHDTDVTAASDHGTHVAGIIGARAVKDSPMSGIAPDCQLILMKVFDDSGTAGDHVLTAALEDALRLGADIVNLSLGRYAGSARQSQVTGLNEVFDKLKAAGVMVVCAVGNESITTARGLLDTTLPPAQYTDFGTVSAPAASEYAFAATSADNSCSFVRYFTRAGSSDTIVYSDTNVDAGVIDVNFTAHFNGQTLAYAVIPGIGAPEDYEGIDVKDKLALVERGEITFVEKINNAAANGAAGVIIYNNEDGDPVKMDLIGAALPALSIRREDGLALAKAKKKEVSFSLANQMLRENENAGKISAFSAWGATPSLTLKPEITAIGGGVLSTIRGGSYAGMSGTSMAAPQLTGVCTLLIEQLKKNEPQLLPTGYDAVIRAALMNTAVPITDEEGTEVSPRAQGAGLIDAGAALAPELRLIYTPTGKPKAELYDLIGDAAYLDFTLENLTDAPLTVTLGASVLTDDYELLGEGEEARYYNTLTSAADTVSRVMLDGVNINKSAGGSLTLTLAPGEVRGMFAVIEPDEAYHKALGEIFTNGHFLEGFVYADTESRSYSLPYMGYCGDWTAAPVLDGTDGLSLFGGTSFVSSAGSINVLLESPEDTDFAFSPDDSGYGDTLAFAARYLRNAAAGKITVTDEAGQLLYEKSTGYVTKSAGVDTPLVFSLGWHGGDAYKSAYRFPDGIYTVTFTFTLDYRSDLTQAFDYRIRIDTAAPELVSLSLDGDILHVESADAGGVKTIHVSESALVGAWSAVADGPAAEFDLSEYNGDILYIELIDYALNTNVVRVRLSELKGAA